MSARRVHRWRDRFVAGLRIGEIADARGPLTQFDRTDYVGGQMYAQGRAYVPQVVDALRQVVAITVETRYEFGERLGPEGIDNLRHIGSPLCVHLPAYIDRAVEL